MATLEDHKAALAEVDARVKALSCTEPRHDWLMTGVGATCRHCRQDSVEYNRQYSALIYRRHKLRDWIRVIEEDRKERN